MKAEEHFAQALLAIEPDKIEGGSPERQNWMGLVLDIYGYLLKHAMDGRRFKDMLIGPEYEERLIDYDNPLGRVR